MARKRYDIMLVCLPQRLAACTDSELMILEECEQLFLSFAISLWRMDKCKEVPVLGPVRLFLSVNGIRRRDVAFKMFGTHRHYNIGYVAECGAPRLSGREFLESDTSSISLYSFWTRSLMTDLSARFFPQPVACSFWASNIDRR